MKLLLYVVVKLSSTVTNEVGCQRCLLLSSIANEIVVDDVIIVVGRMLSLSSVVNEMVVDDVIIVVINSQ